MLSFFENPELLRLCESRDVERASSYRFQHRLAAVRSFFRSIIDRSYSRCV